MKCDLWSFFSATYLVGCAGLSKHEAPRGGDCLKELCRLRLAQFLKEVDNHFGVLCLLTF